MGFKDFFRPGWKSEPTAATEEEFEEAKDFVAKYRSQKNEDSYDSVFNEENEES